MQFKLYLADSLRFTKEVFTGDWSRGGIFLLLCFSSAFFASITNFQPRFYPAVAPYQWWEWIILVVVWLFIWIIILGYYIRIFRGDTVPSSFMPAGALIKDGFVAQIALLVWAIPFIIYEGSILVLHAFYFVWVLDVLWFILFFVAPPIYFIYANTGEFFQSIRPSKILSTIQNAGWGNYIIVWPIVAFIFIVIAFFSFFLNFILVYILPIRFNPSSNFVILGFFFPIFGVFVAKLFTNVFLNRRGSDAIRTENGQ